MYFDLESQLYHQQNQITDLFKRFFHYHNTKQIPITTTTTVPTIRHRKKPKMTLNNNNSKRFTFQSKKRIQPYITNWKWTSSACSIITLIAIIIICIALFIAVMYALSEYRPVYQKYKAIRAKEHTDSKADIVRCEDADNKPNPKAVDCNWVITSYHMDVNSTARWDALSELFGWTSSSSSSVNQHIIYKPWFCGSRCDIILNIMQNNNPACFIILLLLLIVVVVALCILYPCYQRCKSAVEDIRHTPPSYVQEIITAVPPPPPPEYGDLELDDDDAMGAVDLDDQLDHWLDSSSSNKKTKVQ